MYQPRACSIHPVLSLFLVSLTLFLGSSGLAQTPPEATQPADLLLILDASGSMWGQIEGENKVVIARRVVGGMIDGLADDQHVGLVAYGHRREGDCEDIELVTAISPLDREALKSLVGTLNPKGKTPITASLKRAFEEVRGRGVATTILLVSDGLETCGGDPCAAVRAAQAEGLEIVLHVIGFDVAKEDVSQLECAAQAGGGQFLTAENADQLSLALHTAVALPVNAPTGGLSIQAVTNGELQDVWIQVQHAVDGGLAVGARTYVSPETNPRFIPLAPGDYRVSVRALGLKGDIDRQLDVTIAEGEIVEREFDFSVGELKVGATQNENLLDAAVNIFLAGTRMAVAGARTYTSSNNNPKTFALTPGTYDVELKALGIGGDQIRRWEGVTVEPRGSVALSHAFDSGTLRIGVRRGNQLIDAMVNVVNVANGRVEGAGRTYTSPNSNPKTFTLMPGDYTVKIRDLRGDGAREFPITIEADKIVEVVTDFDDLAADP